MNIDQANSISLSAILASLGIKPEKEKPFEDWYLSPLRKEKTASLKVCKKTNKWYDHGEGKGGDVVNFACAYLASTKEDCTVHDALRWIRNMSGNASSIRPVFVPDVSKEEDKLFAYRVEHLSKIKLINYLASRGISLMIAGQYLCQVNLRNAETGKSFYALGFSNEDGGYELRNQIFKGSLKPKSISFIRAKQEGKHNTLNIFEGFMDFLTIAEIRPYLLDEADTIVLNSLANLKKAAPYISQYDYKRVSTWLDNDIAGQKAGENLKAFFQREKILMHRPMNEVYSGHKDVNAWHMHNLGL